MSTKKSKSYNGEVFYVRVEQINGDYSEFDTLKDLMVNAEDGSYDNGTEFYEVEVIRKVKLSNSPSLVEVK